MLVNPDGGGWSCVVLHCDHAIADATLIAHHFVRNGRPSASDTAAIDALHSGGRLGNHFTMEQIDLVQPTARKGRALTSSARVDTAMTQAIQ